MSNNLGSIYATTVNGKKRIFINSDSVDVSGNFFINGTNSRMPAEFENSIRDYIPLTYGTTSSNTNTLFDMINEVSNNLLTSNNDASFGNVDISGQLNVQGDANINGITIGNIYSDAGWNGIRNANITNAGDNDFALLQHEDGRTVVNSSSGPLHMQIANADKMIINSDGDVGIGTSSPEFPLDVNGNMRVGTTDGGYIYWLKGSGYANRISIRGTYLGSDRYKLEFRVRGMGPTVPAMYLRRDGNSNAYLRVNGQQSFGSDNRLKHNEVNLVNALDTINKLQAKVYHKTVEMLDENYNGPLEEETYNKEAGFIAQEVYEIDELKEFVDVGDENEVWGVNYNALFSYNIGATQELHSLVQAQQTEINDLKAENNLLKQENTLIKSKLNEILSEMGKETI